MNYFYENRFPLNKDSTFMSIYQNTNFDFLAHWHTDVEIIYVQEGQIYVSINNEKKLLSQGDMAVCCSCDIHYYESGSFRNKVLIIIFNPELIGLSSNWPEDRRFLSPFILKESAAADLPNVSKLISSILQEVQQKKESYELFIRAQLLTICGYLLRYVPAAPVKKKSEDKSFSKLIKMQKIISYIEANYMKDLTLEQLSEYFNMNLYNLSKDFNAMVGSNFRTYLNTIRITHAEHMILNSKESLIDIALECGFDSVRTFNRAYKKLKGCVPSSLR